MNYLTLALLLVLAIPLGASAFAHHHTGEAGITASIIDASCADADACIEPSGVIIDGYGGVTWTGNAGIGASLISGDSEDDDDPYHDRGGEHYDDDRYDDDRY